MGVGLGNGKSNALVLADGAVEDHALVGVFDGAIDKPISISNGFAGDHGALGDHAVKDVFESLALFSDEVFDRDFDVLEE